MVPCLNSNQGSELIVDGFDTDLSI